MRRWRSTKSHLGSWKRAEGNRYLTYRELADDLVPYVAALGFTHIELMPVAEHPFDGSWGYQPIGLFAPTSRFGAPADFAAFVDRAHAAGLGRARRLGAGPLSGGRARSRASSTARTSTSTPIRGKAFSPTGIR